MNLKKMCDAMKAKGMSEEQINLFKAAYEEMGDEDGEDMDELEKALADLRMDMEDSLSKSIDFDFDTGAALEQAENAAEAVGAALDTVVAGIEERQDHLTKALVVTGETVDDLRKSMDDFRESVIGALASLGAEPVARRSVDGDDVDVVPAPGEVLAKGGEAPDEFFAKALKIRDDEKADNDLRRKAAKALSYAGSGYSVAELKEMFPLQ